MVKEMEMSRGQVVVIDGIWLVEGSETVSTSPF